MFTQYRICSISETYKQFLEENFDDRAYANSIIQGRAISESLAKLADGVSLLDKELHAQVNMITYFGFVHFNLERNDWEVIVFDYCQVIVF